MTRREKLKQLGYACNEYIDLWFKLANGFVKIIDLVCWDYSLDVGVIHGRYEVDKVKQIYEEVRDDFHEVIECEDDEDE